MKKFGLASVLALSIITMCSAVEDTLNPESMNISMQSENLPNTDFANNFFSGFRKYVSFELAGLSRLHARFNLGWRKEQGVTGYDLGIFGGAGHSYSTFGGYGSYLYYFNPQSNLKFYSGLGLDGGSQWEELGYGLFARGIVSVGLSHISNSGRNDFFQINLNCPTALHSKIYARHRPDYGFLEEEPSYALYREISFSKIVWNNIGVNVFYGVFF